MTLFTAFAVYFIIWWLSLFLVLPFGVRSQAEDGSVAHGTDPGAPVRSRILIKLLANTLLSALLFGVWWFVIYRLGYSVDDLPNFFPGNSNFS